MSQMPNMTKNTPVMIVLVVALLGAATMSGCMGFATDGAEEMVSKGAPLAHLSADKMEDWSGETFTFDAHASSDANGEIAAWHFDFGDGHNTTVEHDADARVEHQYAKGGAYTVTVTVIDDGAGQAGVLSDSASVEVVVHERLQIAGSVANEGANLTKAGTARTTFEAHEDVQRFELELDVQSPLVEGATEVAVKVLDHNHTVLANQTVHVSAAQNETVVLEHELVPGTYRVEVEARSGAATFDGELRSYYGHDVIG